MLELGVGDFDQRRLGPYGDTETRLLDHQSVVRAVADGENVLRCEVELVARLDQGVALGHRIHNGVTHLAAELATGKDETVSLHPVETDGAGNRLGEG